MPGSEYWAICPATEFLTSYMQLTDLFSQKFVCWSHIDTSDPSVKLDYAKN